jgi:hypothetical protein
MSELRSLILVFSIFSPPDFREGKGWGLIYYFEVTTFCVVTK